MNSSSRWPTPGAAISAAREELLDVSSPAQIGMSFDVPRLKEALSGIGDDQVLSIFRDGGNASIILENVLGHHLQVPQAPNRNSKWDLTLPDGKAEVKCLTPSSGVKFIPSGQVGSGRTYDEVAFRERLDGIVAFYVPDICAFPDITITLVPTEVIGDWLQRGVLTSGSISNPSRARETIDEMLRSHGITPVS